MTDERARRKPQVISIDDPDLVVSPESITGPRRPLPSAPGSTGSGGSGAGDHGGAMHRPRTLSGAGNRRGLRWGALLLGALGLLGSLALALTFAQFVAVATNRQDWIGWLAFGLLGLAALSLAVILGRDLAGIFRLRRMGRAKANLVTALAKNDTTAERRAIEVILAPLSPRPELKWPLATLAEHTRNLSDPGDLARVVDKELIAVLDGDARRLVAESARRVSVVTALSPMAFLTVGWILVENLRLLRALATLYGGQPGFLGTTRLARMVFTHLVASGSVALTDDLLGQFLGQDLVRRLSRRLGESVFNAALTARIGATAIEVIRPLPFISAPRIRARDFVGEILRRSRGSGPGRTDSAQPEAEPRPIA
jgi:putative membrane protein